MLAFLAHESVGGGANLMLTCVHLTLLAHYDSGRALGDLLHLQMDNTVSEIKTKAMLAYLGYLVHRATSSCAREDISMTRDTLTLISTKQSAPSSAGNTPL